MEHQPDMKGARAAGGRGSVSQPSRLCSSSNGGETPVTPSLHRRDCKDSGAVASACAVVRGYQLFVSPLLHALCGPGGGCRFTPSCSEYVLQALRTHGLIRGGALGIRRVLRCHPFGGMGHDPVPGIGITREGNQHSEL
jgi:putative membrane protein insertion efficiency factor